MPHDALLHCVGYPKLVTHVHLHHLHLHHGRHLGHLVGKRVRVRARHIELRLLCLGNGRHALKWRRAHAAGVGTRRCGSALSLYFLHSLELRRNLSDEKKDVEILNHLIEGEILKERRSCWVRMEDPQHLLASIGKQLLGISGVGDRLPFLRVAGRC